MAIPDKNEIDLRLVRDEINREHYPLLLLNDDNFNGLLRWANDSKFDPKYVGLKDRLTNFRNYGGTPGEPDPENPGPGPDCELYRSYYWIISLTGSIFSNIPWALTTVKVGTESGVSTKPFDSSKIHISGDNTNLMLDILPPTSFNAAAAARGRYSSDEFEWHLPHAQLLVDVLSESKLVEINNHLDKIPGANKLDRTKYYWSSSEDGVSGTNITNAWTVTGNTTSTIARMQSRPKSMSGNDVLVRMFKAFMVESKTPIDPKKIGSIFSDGMIVHNEVYKRSTQGNACLWDGPFVVEETPIDPDPPVDPNVPTDPNPGTSNCGASVTYSGGNSYPSTTNVTMGSSSGDIEFRYKPQSIPDRFIVSERGNILLDTGYVGYVDYSYGGASREDFNSHLTGKVDPITKKKYPIIELHPEDGYPLVGHVNYNSWASQSIEKSQGMSDVFKVDVYAPMSGTAWSFEMLCPVPGSGSGGGDGGNTGCSGDTEIILKTVILIGGLNVMDKGMWGGTQSMNTVYGLNPTKKELDLGGKYNTHLNYMAGHLTPFREDYIGYRVLSYTSGGYGGWWIPSMTEKKLLYASQENYLIFMNSLWENGGQSDYEADLWTSSESSPDSSWVFSHWYTSNSWSHEAKKSKIGKYKSRPVKSLTLDGDRRNDYSIGDLVEGGIVGGIVVFRWKCPQWSKVHEVKL